MGRLNTCSDLTWLFCAVQVVAETLKLLVASLPCAGAKLGPTVSVLLIMLVEVQNSTQIIIGTFQNDPSLQVATLLVTPVVGRNWLQISPPMLDSGPVDYTACPRLLGQVDMPLMLPE